MNEMQVKIEALKMARESLGNDADIYDQIDYAEKLKFFVEDNFTSREIKDEFAGRD